MGTIIAVFVAGAVLCLVLGLLRHRKAASRGQRQIDNSFYGGGAMLLAFALVLAIVAYLTGIHLW